MFCSYLSYKRTIKNKRLQFPFGVQEYLIYNKHPRVPMDLKGKSETDIPIHLGYVIKAKEIKILVDELMNIARNSDNSQFNLDKP